MNLDYYISANNFVGNTGNSSGDERCSDEIAQELNFKDGHFIGIEIENFRSTNLIY